MTDSHDEASRLGTYLYCLAKPECLSLVKSLAEQAGQGHGAVGIDEQYPISSLEQDGIVGVIGKVDPNEFHDENLQRLDWIGPRVCRHEAVVEAVMGASPVLPVKFGTIFRSHTALIRLLGRHSQTITSFLEELQDKAEWSVKGYLHDEAARQRVATEDSAIQSRLASLSASPGVRYMQQKQVDTMIEAALREWVGRLVRDIQEALATHAVEQTELKLLSPTVTGRSERMIFNGGFLVAHSALPDFRAALAAQNPIHSSSGLTLELRGPWPPYNFCPILSELDPNAE